VFTQVNIPIFGDANKIPGFDKFELEGSWRHDQYSDVNGTSNPKVAFNWTISEDLGVTVRGAWGTSFRAPGFGELSPLANNAIAGWNSALFPQSSTINVNCGADPASGAGKLAPFTGCGPAVQPVGVSLLGAAPTAIKAGFRDYVNTEGQSLHPEQGLNWALGGDFAPTSFLKGLDLQATWYSVKITGAIRTFGNPTSQGFNDPSRGFAYIVPTDLIGVDPACNNNLTPTTCPEFESMVFKILSDPRNPVSPQIQTLVQWINDGGSFNKGWVKVSGIDWAASYDWDMEDLGAWNVGVVGTYYLHQYDVTNPATAAGAVVQDLFHTTLASVGGIPQVGVESLPRMRYRARLGWSNGPWSLTGFMDYQSHFFHTQAAPPNVNFQCTTAGGVTPGGSNPCAISNYTNIEPSYYTFDLSFGYDTGDDPVNDYLKHIGIQLVAQNILDKHPPFMYRTSTGGGNPTAFDITKSDQGRTLSLIVTKTW
jgi:hypothetical protein